MKFLKKRNNKKGFTHQNFPKKILGGFTLVETLVAISIFSVSLITIMSVLGGGISDTAYAKKKLTAGYLAQEGIEYIRNMRDTEVLSGTTPTDGWDAFKTQFDLNGCTESDRCGFSTANPIVISDCGSNPSACELYVDAGNYNSNSAGDDSGFSRTVWMDTISSDEVKIYSAISWDQGSGTVEIILSDNLYNWVEW